MKIFIFLTLMINTSIVFGHGGNKPGPNGGHIQMPGAFHTELVIEKQMARVYLLDINFKNPTTESSNILFTAFTKSKAEKVSCVDKKTYYECPLSEKASNYSNISIKATRKKANGKEALYDLPLTFPKAVPPQPVTDETHHNH